MQFRGLYPGGAFLPVLLGVVLVLLSRELAPLGRGAVPVVPGGWVCLTDPEVGSRFHSFQAGELLGSLVSKELPGLSGLLADRCKGIPLETGTEIRLVKGPGSRERGCVVAPLPEQCRYLLGMPINVNRAGEEELALLPGIGPNLARRMIEVRESVGSFSSPEEILHVPGIGKKLLQKIQGRICF
jgi:competence ComEA-like helix-hairpin-helix protein